MNIAVQMKWNESSQKWLMLLPNGHMLYDFWDCGNINRLFCNGLDKENDKWFELTIKERNNVQRKTT